MTSPHLTTFHRTEAQSNRARGFSLLEMLIALLVLSVGLLGIAGLQTVSLRFNHQSYERTQATVLISEMFEKITANPVAARAGSFDSVNTSGTFTGFGGCPTSCTSAQLATYDLSRWKISIEDPRRLAQGSGTIFRAPGDPDGVASHVYDITVNWVENGLGMSQTMRMRTQRTQLP